VFKLEFVTFALLAVLIGMRHGMDGDHVAAIADMVGSEEQKRKQVSLGIMYAFGHGLIVLVIGLLSIYIGLRMPQTTQYILEIFVSITLIALGGFIIYSIYRQKKEYEYKSRLKIVCEFIASLVRKTKIGDKVNSLSPISLGIIGAFIVGIIHGIGVESPTQIAVITNAVGLNNSTAALLQLILFVFGLLIATVGMTFCLSWGFMKARFKRKLFLVLGSVTGAYSLGLGILMLVDMIKGGA
jgi:high-affinity nickel-transport protein